MVRDRRDATWRSQDVSAASVRPLHHHMGCVVNITLISITRLAVAPKVRRSGPAQVVAL